MQTAWISCIYLAQYPHLPFCVVIYKQLIYLSFQLLKDVVLFSLELCGGQGPVGHPPGVYLAWTVGHGRPSGRGQIGAVDIHHTEHFVVDQQGAAQD